MRENRPDIIKVQKALNEFVQNSLYNNNFTNVGYTQALNFKVEN